MMHEWNENINKEIETIKKNQKETLKEKNTITELRILLEGINSRFNQKKEPANLKIGNKKSLSQRNKRKKNEEKWRMPKGLMGYHQTYQYSIMEVPED